MHKNIQNGKIGEASWSDNTNLPREFARNGRIGALHEQVFENECTFLQTYIRRQRNIITRHKVNDPDAWR